MTTSFDFVNVVPSPATREAARAMLRDAAKIGGPEAVLRHAHRVRPEQMWALLAQIVGDRAPVERELGGEGPAELPDLFTPAERRAGNTAYAQGVRTPTVVAQYREYQRLAKRAQRAQAAEGGGG